jgi:hypothetical protein
MIKVVQGFNLRYSVKTDSSQLIIKGDDVKYIIEDIEETDGRYFIFAPRDVTKDWIPGEYKYQILNEDGI